MYVAGRHVAKGGWEPTPNFDTCFYNATHADLREEESVSSVSSMLTANQILHFEHFRPLSLCRTSRGPPRSREVERFSVCFTVLLSNTYNQASITNENATAQTVQSPVMMKTSSIASILDAACLLCNPPVSLVLGMLVRCSIYSTCTPSRRSTYISTEFSSFRTCSVLEGCCNLAQTATTVRAG